MGALEGIRVIEFAEGVSGPYCARLFADFGADVVKVEAPEKGDEARAWGPFPGDVPHVEKSGTFQFLNTNKRGISLDVETPRGRELFLELLAGADALIENQHPRAMRQLGRDHASLAADFPDLVQSSSTPYGQTGPYSEWKGCDLNAFHFSGAGSRYCGRPDEMPLEHGTFSADFFGACTGATWGLAAILGRKRTGMPCKDGHVCMLALEPGQWKGLVKVIGNPEWAQAEIFEDMFMRGQNADAIYPLLEMWTLEHGKDEIMERCQAAGVPVTAVFTVPEVFADPQVLARGMKHEMEHPKSGTGTCSLIGNPIKMSLTKLDLPEPDTPVTATMQPSGNFASIDLRLFSAAP